MLLLMVHYTFMIISTIKISITVIKWHSYIPGRGWYGESVAGVKRWLSGEAKLRYIIKITWT